MASISSWNDPVRVQSKGELGKTIALADGRFVTLSVLLDSKFRSSTSAQYFNADGTVDGAPIIDPQRFAPGAIATPLPDGGLAVAWSNSGDVYARRLGIDAGPIGDEVFVNTREDGFQYTSSIVTLISGGFVVAYDEFNFQSSDGDTGPRLQRFDSAGDPVGPEIAIAFQSSGDIEGREPDLEYDDAASVVPLSNGNFVVTWIHQAVVYGEEEWESEEREVTARVQVFDQDGHALGPVSAFESPWGNVSGTPLSNGGFVLASSAGNIINLRVCDADGSPLGEAVQFATHGYGTISGLDIATLNDGRIVATWFHNINNVRAAIFNPDGSPSVAEFRVAELKSQFAFPQVNVLADGRIVFTWTDGSQTSKAGVYQQIYDPRLSAIDLDGTRLGDQLIGTKWGDVIEGLTGGDLLDGGKGRDTIIGGAGRDTLTGGKGADHFVFEAKSESRPLLRDAITDFELDRAGEVIDLSALSLDDLVWRGTSKFKSAGGEVRYHFDGPNKTIVQIDLDADSDAEMEIALIGHVKLSAGDFIL